MPDAIPAPPSRRRGLAFSGGRFRHARRATAVSAVLAAALACGAAGQPSGGLAAGAPGANSLVRVIVREVPGRDADATHAVAAAGGHVGLRLDLIGGFVAEVPAAAVALLQRAAGIANVSPDRSVRLAEQGSTPGPTSSMAQLARAIGANDLWRDHITGAGVDVALIDSGVVPVNGLTAPGKVVNGPDLSFDLQAGAPAYLDTFGHGTHMAGIIAGRDDSIGPGERPGYGEYAGVAPDARIVNVKVASAAGETDVSQVIAAIDWVVQHRTAGGLNIRVLNLSFGTNGTQDYRIDPLAYAVEVAWRKGIVVVTAAGNSGDHGGPLADPAADPYVIAVGAEDMHATTTSSDDTVPSWSSAGDGTRGPDVVAPGVSVAGLRDPGSILDLATPSATGSRFIRGSGTSQAAAVVSGGVALLLQRHPDLTPDQVKGALVATATPLAGASPTAQGAGLIDLEAAAVADVSSATQTWPRSTGTGSLDAARGSLAVQAGGSPLGGERDIFGAPWDGSAWAQQSLDGTSWVDGSWNGNPWTGTCLCAASWSGPAWAAVPWSGLSWSGLSWSGLSWSGLTWSGVTASGLSWSGLSWSGLSWSGLSWSAQSWAGLSWSGLSWSTAGWASLDWTSQ